MYAIDKKLRERRIVENNKDEIQVNGLLVMNALAMFISASQLLSQARNKLVDGKLYDQTVIQRAFETAQSAITEIEGTRLAGEIDTYKVDPDIFKGILGIAETSGELCEALCNVMLHDYDFNICYNLTIELGEISEYLATVTTALENERIKNEAE